LIGNKAKLGSAATRPRIARINNLTRMAIERCMQISNTNDQKARSDMREFIRPKLVGR